MMHALIGEDEDYAAAAYLIPCILMHIRPFLHYITDMSYRSFYNTHPSQLIHMTN